MEENISAGWILTLSLFVEVYMVLYVPLILQPSVGTAAA
jgi:hypothetical protein